MFVKVTRSGGRSYVKLVEAFRDDAGVSRQKVIATLGRLEQVRAGSADALLNGLRRVTAVDEAGGSDGSAAAASIASPGEVLRFSSALSVGDTWLLNALWHRLGFGDGFRRVLRNGRTSFDCERMLRVMVFNRLCDPTSKLGVMRWLEGARVPAVDAADVTHQRLLRTMDTLADRADAMQRSLAVLLRPLIDQDLSVVFYDLTTVGVEGATELPGDVRAHGLSKDGGIARQFMLGVVQTAEGLPIAHRVWEGNTGEASTLKPVVEEVLEHFAVKRIVLVADRGLLSLDNLAQLQQMKVGGKTGRPLEFILAVPGRRYAEFTELLQPIHETHCAKATEEVMGETAWESAEQAGGQKLRLVWAHDPQRAAEQGSQRQKTIDELLSQAQLRAGKLDEQDEGKAFRGRRLSDSGAKAWLYREVCEARLGAIVKVDLQSEKFSYDIDERALQRARLNDGKLLLVTNVADLSVPEVVSRYKSLADIERGFKVLKSDIEIAPVFHRLPERIRAHALICFLALVLHRVMRMQLKDAKSPYSPERALEIARRIQFHRVTLADQATACGVSELDPMQREIFNALKLELPTKDRLETAV
jgi:transposase